MTSAPRNATDVVRAALAGSGIEVVGSCAIEAYDSCAPQPFRAAAWLPEARGVVVAGSAGPSLWRAFVTSMAAAPARWGDDHPYDAFVSRRLARADDALAASGIAFRRFEAAMHAPVRFDFVALARLAGLGIPGPFGLSIHPEHGAWWALRGAWMVDAEVEPARRLESPCAECPAPCVGGRGNLRGIELATVDARNRCVIGQASRYDDDQIAYHYDRSSAVARIQKSGS